MAKVRFNKNFDINRVVKRLVYTILSLYVGGTIITVFGQVMNCTSSPFYDGLTLIGWTVSDAVNTSATCTTLTANPANNVITDPTGAGVLSVIGIIGIAGVVMEFVSFR